MGNMFLSHILACETNHAFDYATRIGSAALFLLMFTGGCSSATSAVQADTTREESVCNVVLEPFAFWLWQRSAGEPRLQETRLPDNAEVIHQRTTDGRLLAGYRLKARIASGQPPRGFALIAQGNATLAEQLLHPMQHLAERGYDVFLFDYRGYGRSEGKRRLKAIAHDYRELYAELGRTRPGKRLLYGMSFGGIVLLNVIGSGARFDRAVIDSTPSTVSNYGCPENYDPVANLPADASGLLLISGDRDRVVTAKDSAALLDAAEARGARSMRSPDFAHPFMDNDPAVALTRRRLIQEFLAGH